MGLAASQLARDDQKTATKQPNHLNDLNTEEKSSHHNPRVRWLGSIAAGCNGLMNSGGDSASERTRANTDRRLTRGGSMQDEDENGNEDFSPTFFSMQNSSSSSSSQSSSAGEEHHSSSSSSEECRDGSNRIRVSSLQTENEEEDEVKSQQQSYHQYCCEESDD